MIHGTEVELFGGGETETVENVLIGEPYTADRECGLTEGFVLGIPKGDTHDWTDKKVRFFGKFYRTVGFPQEGMSENIPLFWNKKVKVELLKANGSCTFYEKNSYIRHVLEDVFFYDGRGELTAKTGSRPEGILSIYSYGVNAEKSGYIPRVGDIAAVGETDFEFDTSGERELSESMKKFREICGNFAVVREVSVRFYGKAPDLDIKAV